MLIPDGKDRRNRREYRYDGQQDAPSPEIRDRHHSSPDDNFVRIGDVYELFYHGGKDGWISLGQKKATDTFLVYDNMPRGALFYLHDITRGKEEQVFRIENGKQVFISNFGK